MVSRHACGLLAGAAIVLSSISATAQAQVQKSIHIERWGKNDALPYMDAHLTVNPNAPQAVLDAFAGDNNQTEYAGIFGGYDNATGNQRWDVFCDELNHNINLPSDVTFNIYNNYLATPIQTGVPQNNGPKISVDQKMLINQLISHCLGLTAPMGMDPVGETAQDLLGFYEYNKTRLYNATSNPQGMTNQKAGAAQMMIWEIVHENWNYGTRTKPLDQYDPTWLAANLSNINLKSGWLQWSYDNTTPDAFGYTVDDYFSGNTAKNPNMIGLKNCAYNAYYQSVVLPEATTAILGGIAVWPFLTARRRRPLHA